MAQRRQPTAAESAAGRAADAWGAGRTDGRCAGRPARDAAGPCRTRGGAGPCRVAGKRATVPLQLPERTAPGLQSGEWQLEGGDIRRTESRWERLPVERVQHVDDERFVTRQVSLPPRLPVGYHRLVLECGQGRFETEVFCAPERCFQGSLARRNWACSLPFTRCIRNAVGGRATGPTWRSSSRG